MQNSGLPEISQTGQKYVEQWLTENGYTNILEISLQANENGLLATGRIQSILVLVRSFLHPHKPYKLSDYEVDLLIRRATKLKLVAYAAYVVLDCSGKLIEEIAWERLN